MRAERGRILALVIGILAALVVGEVALRAIGTFETYSEKNYGDYRTYYGETHPTWFHLYTPDTHQAYESGEFHFDLDINSLGIRDVEHDPRRPPGRFRAIALGDSYTEGVGAQFQDARFKQLERDLQRRGYPIDFIGGGVSGSDTLYELKLLEHELLPFEPSLVILAVNTTDIADLVMRGGESRFLPDGTTRFRDPPAFHTAYRYSHLVRLLVHRVWGYDYALVRPDERNRLETEARAEILEAIVAMQSLARARGFRLLVVFHPTLREFRTDLRSAFGEAFLAGLERAGVDHVEILEAMRGRAGTHLEEYGWPIDGHFNGRGYALFAAAVESVLVHRRLLPPRPAGAARRPPGPDA